jgi:hypothetical protein
MLSLDAIVLRALRAPLGTLKVEAALGELLTANAMSNLWFYQGLKGDLRIPEASIEQAGRRIETIYRAVNEAWSVFEETEDKIAASKRIIPILRSAAAELRSFLGNLDFYDDDQLDPEMRSATEM